MRTTHALLLAAALLVAVAAVGCGDDEPPVIDEPTLDPFFAEDYRESYVEVADCRSSIDGHNPHTIRVHVSADEAQTYLEGKTLLEGTVIVKTETAGLPGDCDTDPVVRITAMLKGPAGTAPQSGDWIWQEFIFSPEKSAREGQLAECIACHTGAECPWDFTCVERPPSACFEIAVVTGAPLTFRFDASCSSSNDEASAGLEFRWDFDGDGEYDYPVEGGYTADPVAEWTPPQIQAYDLTLQVRNAAGNTGKSTQTLDPGDLTYVVPDEGDPGVLYTWAGNGKPGFDGDGNPLLESRFSQPADLAFTSSGIFILDWNNHCVRTVEDGKLRTVIGDPTFPGDGPGVHFPGEDDRIAPVPGRHSLQNHPTQMIELPNQELVLAAWHNHKVRQYDPTSEMIWVTCGDGPGFAGDGGPHSSGVKFKQVEQVRYHDGDLYILDQVNLRVRRIRDYLTDPEGIIETVVGRGEPPGFEGDGGPPLEAALNYELSDNPPMNGAIVFDDQGRLYISDTLNHRIRVVDFGANLITTFAGNGQPGYSGDGGPATSASINWPLDLEIHAGKLYFCDEYNHAVRAIDLQTGIITTVAGRGERLVSNYDVAPSWEIGDGRAATEAYLNHPRGIAFDPEGRLYIVDTFQYRIRRMVLSSN